MTLPLPDRILHPNSRPHWTQRSKATREHRQWAKVAVQEATTALPADASRVVIKRTFYVPDRRARDIDGLEYSCKAFHDGIADALGVNDRIFTWLPSEVIVERGRREVVFEIDVEV